MEKRSHIKTASVVQGNVAQFNVSTFTGYSEVKKVECNCGEGESSVGADGLSFSCTYGADGVYEVRYTVYTSVENEYTFVESVTIKLHEGSSYGGRMAGPSKLLLSLLMGQYLLAIVLVMFIRI